MAKNKSEEPINSKEGDTLPAFGLAEDILGKVSKEEPSVPKGGGSNGGKNRATGGEVLEKFVTFFLGNEEYGLPISQVQEINRVGEVTRVPNSPEHVRGVMNLRGKIVPVIELKSRLRLGETEVDKQSRIVVVEHGPKVIGLMVDSVSQVLNMSSEHIENAPEEVVKVDENYIKGVGKIDDRMVILLDLGQIIKHGGAA